MRRSNQGAPDALLVILGLGVAWMFLRGGKKKELARQKGMTPSATDLLSARERVWPPAPPPVSAAAKCVQRCPKELISVTADPETGLKVPSEKCVQGCVEKHGVTIDDTQVGSVIMGGHPLGLWALQQCASSHPNWKKMETPSQLRAIMEVCSRKAGIKPGSATQYASLQTSPSPGSRQLPRLVEGEFFPTGFGSVFGEHVFS
jgi:hypothetical protein